MSQLQLQEKGHRYRNQILHFIFTVSMTEISLSEQDILAAAEELHFSKVLTRFDKNCISVYSLNMKDHNSYTNSVALILLLRHLKYSRCLY